MLLLPLALVAAALSAGSAQAAAAADHAPFGAVALPAADLAPRSYAGFSPALAAVVRRQDDSPACKAGTHPCNDINAPAVCCTDDKYCIVDPLSHQPACCAIGSTCGSACDASQFQCNATLTTTSSPAPTALDACCGRACPATSMFACPRALGGGCCHYGQTCVAGRACAWTATPTSAPVSTRVSMLPSDCTTSQVACAASDGGGCCDAGRACTVVTGANYCVQATVAPTGNITAVAQGGELSVAAKAGIGAGVAVGASALIGGVAWFCLRRRRGGSSPQRSRSNPYRRGVGGGYGGAGSNGGAGGGGGGQPMSESTSDAGGLAQDYFGPDAGVGPYTDMTPGHESSQVTTPGRGVPMEPHSPGDIVAPVEIGSTGRRGGDDANSSRASVTHSQQVPETIEGRFELYSEYPSPPSEDPTPLSLGGGVVSPVSESGRSRAVSNATHATHHSP